MGIQFEIIRRRNSLRSYSGDQLSDGDRMELERRIGGCLENPFGATVRLPLMDAAAMEGKKLGTYGVIRNATLYLAGVAKAGRFDLEAVGYSMERAVLEATAIGLGTCWLAGTYDHKAFREAAGLGGDERLAVVSPIGYPARKRTLLDYMMRGVAGSANRKPWESLFFDGSPDKPLSAGAADGYGDALEAVRLAPSASNSQPWRVIRQGGRYHFYRFAKPGNEFNRIDMGIAACHFELVARENGERGGWSFDAPAIGLPESFLYFATWNPEA